MTLRLDALLALFSIAPAVQGRDLTGQGIYTVSIEINAEAPAPEDRVDTQGRLRSQLVAGAAALP